MTLVGDLHLPQGPGPHPAVIFVHGSGELDRDCLGFYQPLFEEFTKAGFACLSWDKPGVGESTRPQGAYDDRESFFERATEVRKAIDFLKSRDEIDPERIGLWGISRAGWIMPMVASRTDDVAFVIAVSCAGTDSLAQGAYQARCHEAGEDCSEKEIIAALAREGTGSHPEPKPPDGFWEHLEGRNSDYVSNPAMNAHKDGSPYINARPFLEQMTCPVLAIYGEDDRDVPPHESARIYQEALEEAGNPDVTVKVYSNANHFLLQADKMDQLSSYLERGDWPWTPGYLELMSDWLVERFVEPW
jgi:pimeloyl-ACP methyl ester carboxylesterase